VILFSLREGWRNFSNLTIYGLLTIVSLLLTLTLAGVSLSGYRVIDSWRDGLLGRFEIEAFLVPDADSSRISDISDRIAEIDEVGEMQIVTREDAALKFADQFGSDLFDLLTFNPLPPSIIVRLKPGCDPSVSWERVSRAISAIEGVEDVVYQGELLASVERFIRRGWRIALAVVGTMLVVSLLFTVLTVIGVIRSREEFIRVIALAGGSRAMASGPFVAMGAYYGLTAGLIAAGVVTALGWLSEVGLGIYCALPITWRMALVVGGVLMGIVGAGWAVKRRVKLY